MLGVEIVQHKLPSAGIRWHHQSFLLHEWGSIVDLATYLTFQRGLKGCLEMLHIDKFSPCISIMYWKMILLFYYFRERKKWSWTLSQKRSWRYVDIFAILFFFTVFLILYLYYNRFWIASLDFSTQFQLQNNKRLTIIQKHFMHAIRFRFAQEIMYV